MKFDAELAELAHLLRVGAETARTIAERRGQDEASIFRLAAQAEAIALAIDTLVAESQPPAFRLKRDR